MNAALGDEHGRAQWSSEVVERGGRSRWSIQVVDAKPAIGGRFGFE
jgi:hypothetical protein